MFKDPLHWFPSPIFSTLLAVVFFGSYLIDYAVPKITAPKTSGRAGRDRDRSSFRAPGSGRARRGCLSGLQVFQLQRVCTPDVEAFSRLVRYPHRRIRR